jgi:hypothetical protein
LPPRRKWHGAVRSLSLRTATEEIFICDKVHEDAQYSNEHILQEFQDDPEDTEEAQITFVSAPTSSAFSLAANGAINYGWSSFADTLKNGTFLNARRK